MSEHGVGFEQRIAAAIGDHVEICRHLLSTEFSLQNLKPGSSAYEALIGQEKYATGAVGPVPVREALGEMHLSAVAGLDHLSAVADVLQSDSRIGFAIATIARGGIEAYGRAWFLASSPNNNELVVRWLRTRIDSLRWLAFATEDEPDANKINVDLGEMLTADAKHLGAKEFKLSFAKLATAVLDASYLDGSGGKKMYSRLSSVAHADRAGMNMLMTHGPSIAPGLHEVTLEISPQYLQECLHPILSVHGRVTAAICDLFGGTQDDKEFWLGHYDAVCREIGDALAEAGMSFDNS